MTILLVTYNHRMTQVSIFASHLVQPSGQSRAKSDQLSQF